MLSNINKKKVELKRQIIEKLLIVFNSFTFTIN